MWLNCQYNVNQSCEDGSCGAIIFIESLYDFILYPLIRTKWRKFTATYRTLAFCSKKQCRTVWISHTCCEENILKHTTYSECGPKIKGSDFPSLSFKFSPQSNYTMVKTCCHLKIMTKKRLTNNTWISMYYSIQMFNFLFLKHWFPVWVNFSLYRGHNTQWYTFN
jgi:hypothetical protein